MDKNNDAKKYALGRRFKKIGLLAVGISVPLIALFVVVSVLPRDKKGSETENSEFSIRMDSSTEAEHFSMYGSLDAFNEGKSSRYEPGSPLKNAYVTKAETVMNYVDGLSKNDIMGSKNLAEESPEKKQYDLAIVHSVILNNDSGEEDQKFKYSVTLDNYKEPTNTAINPFEYLRIVTQVSEIDASDSLSINKATRFFGAKHQKDNLGTLVAIDDNRETISKQEKVTNDDAITVRKAAYIYEENEYCTNFLEDYDTTIVNESLVIPAGKTLRFTFISYLEATDPDCYGAEPKESELLMSLHFGV